MDLSASDDDSRPQTVHHPRHFKAPPHPTNLSASRQKNSVPSLYQGVETRNDLPYQQEQLAFTTEELELTHASGSHDIHRNFSAVSGGKGKRRVKRGHMSARNITTAPGLTSIINTTVVNQDASNGAAPGVRARPTVTTILRRNHVLETVERKERDKLDSLMLAPSTALDFDDKHRLQEKKDTEEAKAAEAKRMLASRLAYEKAIAASRKVATEKQKIAEGTRVKQKQWQLLVAEQREAEMERRKQLTEALQKATEDSKRAFEEMTRLKHVKATQVKEETEQLQAEAKRKQLLEERLRQDKIQQIQAAKLAMKRTKQANPANPNQFYRSIAVPETQIKLRLQKEEDERRLEETRRKIQAAKQIKSVKLIRAMKKIQSHENVAQMQKIQKPGEEQRGSSIPATGTKSSAIASATSGRGGGRGGAGGVGNSKDEIDDMLQQLHQLKKENLQKRMSQVQQPMDQVARRQPPPQLLTPNIKVIGIGRPGKDRSSINNNFQSKSASSFYSRSKPNGVISVGQR